MKPAPHFNSPAKAKGGRAQGGTRYYGGKSRGEDKMVRLMQKALNRNPIDDLINSLKLSCMKTSMSLQEIKL